jgi:hypothetical protein
VTATIDAFTLGIPAIIAMAGIFFSLVLERLVRPQCQGLLRPWSSVLIHAGLLLAAWALTLLVARRPAFALMLVLAGQLVVIQINNAKYRALREPFLFSDFGIFSQTIKHPRLYLPFLGIGRAGLIAFVVTMAVGFGWWMERPAPDFMAWAGGTSIAGLVLLALGLASAKAPTLDPEKDLADQGLFTSIAQYWLREKATKTPRETTLPFVARTRNALPDIVVIQSESFFDARRLLPGIKQDILHHYDEACAAATLHGRLSVPAWGANTMRPEFAFLTGLAPASLGIHRFNPYRCVTRRPLNALPAVLREAGYRTTCIHPHPARFFRRDRAFSNLGFDRFVDIKEFRGAQKTGPYISDAAVTDKLLLELEAAEDPSFFFVITMENHGPLHLESIADEDVRDLYDEAPPAGCEDLTVYLRHLRNADRQLGRLRAHLRTRARPTILCFYGEHLPSMPKVYDVLGLPDGKTDFFLQLMGTQNAGRRDLEIEELPLLILRALATQ